MEFLNDDPASAELVELYKSPHLDAGRKRSLSLVRGFNLANSWRRRLLASLASNAEGTIAEGGEADVDDDDFGGDAPAPVVSQNFGLN